jgi:F-type H+-transporting ATPase subunit delta
VASSAAKRYAQAVFDLGKEQNTLDAWQNDLARLSELTGDRMASAFFANPSVSQDRKIELIGAVLANSSDQARNLGRLLVERDRTPDAPAILEMFEGLVRADRGIVVAEVTTAEPLSPEGSAMIRERLQEMVGKQVEMREHTDPSIIGGIVARVGDTVIDGSVTSQLQKLRARLVSGA